MQNDEVFDDNDENIVKFIDINEINTESSNSFVAAIEQCPSKAATRHSQSNWYTIYTLSDDKFASLSDFAKIGEREKLGNAEFPRKGPDISDYKIGDEIAAIEAIQNINETNSDIMFLAELNGNMRLMSFKSNPWLS